MVLQYRFQRSPKIGGRPIIGSIGRPRCWQAELVHYTRSIPVTADEHKEELAMQPCISSSSKNVPTAMHPHGGQT